MLLILPSISYLFLLLHLNGHCFGSGPHFLASYFKLIWQTSAWESLVKYRSDVVARLRVSQWGFWEPSGSSLISLTFLCFAFIYRLHLSHRHPLYRCPYTLPSSTKEGPFAFPTLKPLFILFSQPPYPSTWKSLIHCPSLTSNIIISSESLPDQAFPAESSDHPN